MAANVPARFKATQLLPGEQKLGIRKETKVPNAAVFTVNKEDHTVGNLLRDQLLKDQNVIFAGYKCPHPLEPKFELRLQTTPNTTPHDALKLAIAALIGQLNVVDDRFHEALKDRTEE